MQPDGTSVNMGHSESEFERLRTLLLDPERAVAALPQEERDEHARCQQSVIDARRSANANEGQRYVG